MTFCSFCGKAQNEVRKMIAGPAGVHICDSCVSVCKTIIDRELSGAPEEGEVSKAEVAEGVSRSLFNMLRPAEITAGLDQHIISQDYAKRALAVAVYNHYKRLRSEDRIDRRNRVFGSRWQVRRRASGEEQYSPARPDWYG